MNDSTNHPPLPARDIIVIGASEGGIEVIRTLLAGLPADLPAAVMIVVHTGPSSPGYLATIFDQRSSLPVRYGKQGDVIKRGNVYLAPAARHLEIVEPGLLNLSSGPKVRFARPAVDRLFMTAATVFGERVISLILSGGDGDGTDGAKAIHQAGGLNFVQDPDEAAVASMPLNAIIHDDPRARLKVAEMAGVLTDVVLASRRRC